jgi:F-type H+-transporting ATPase subunit delta
MTPRAIARQYATALFDVARQLSHVDRVAQDMADLRAIVASSRDLQAVFETPVVPPRKKRDLVEALLVAGGGVSDEVRRLLLLLADRDRLMFIDAIAHAFAERVLEARNIVSAEVVTAVPVSAARCTALAEALGAATGRQVTVTARVDPAIVGGVIARVGSFVFDGTVVRQIERMRERLVGEA